LPLQNMDSRFCGNDKSGFVQSFLNGDTMSLSETQSIGLNVWAK
jgi:hypothetical protein